MKPEKKEEENKQPEYRPTFYKCGQCLSFLVARYDLDPKHNVHVFRWHVCKVCWRVFDNWSKYFCPNHDSTTNE